MRDVNCPAFRVSKAGMVLTEVANAKLSADLKKTCNYALYASNTVQTSGGFNQQVMTNELSFQYRPKNRQLWSKAASQLTNHIIITRFSI